MNNLAVIADLTPVSGKVAPAIPVPKHGVGAHVRMLPLDGLKGRVVGITWDFEGLRYTVRYFDNSEAKTCLLFADEVEAA